MGIATSPITDKQITIHLPLKIEGHYRVLAHDAQTGRLIHEQRTRNTIPDNGWLGIFTRMFKSDATLSFYNWLAIGIDGSATASNQAALVNEKFRTAIAQAKATKDGVTVVAFIGPTQGNGETYREVGLFNAASGGLILNRAIHDPQAKTSSISLTYISEIVRV